MLVCSGTAVPRRVRARSSTRMYGEACRLDASGASTFPSQSGGGRPSSTDAPIVRMTRSRSPATPCLRYFVVCGPPVVGCDASPPCVSVGGGAGSRAVEDQAAATREIGVTHEHVRIERGIVDEVRRVERLRTLVDETNAVQDVARRDERDVVRAGRCTRRRSAQGRRETCSVRTAATRGTAPTARPSVRASARSPRCASRIPTSTRCRSSRRRRSTELTPTRQMSEPPSLNLPCRKLFSDGRHVGDVAEDVRHARRGPGPAGPSRNPARAA